MATSKICSRADGSIDRLVTRSVLEDKKSDRQRACAVECQVGEGGAEDWGELEAVAGEAGDEDDVRVLRVPVDDEVFVGRHRVEADRVVGDAMRDAGQVGGEEIDQSLLFVGGRSCGRR